MGLRVDAFDRALARGFLQHLVLSRIPGCAASCDAVVMYMKTTECVAYKLCAEIVKNSTLASLRGILLPQAALGTKNVRFCDVTVPPTL